MIPIPRPISLEIFRHLFASVAEEMGGVLERTAYSPNIKERRDYSAAIYDPAGLLVAQAAHIPVHLGAMPAMVQALMQRVALEPGDMVVCNDPSVGGTHLPDISLVMPVFVPRRGQTVLAGVVANRAHHADVGGASPGSMPAAREIFQEGLVIPPLKIMRRGELDEQIVAFICANVRTPEERRGDLAAQIAANQTGARRWTELTGHYGLEGLTQAIREAHEYARRATQALLNSLPQGSWEWTDYLDDDGVERGRVPVHVRVTIRDGTLACDFTGSAPQRSGGVNATEAVTRSACYFVLGCLLEEDAPLNAGCFEPVRVIAPSGTVVNATHPAAIAGGNVETSQRIVDALLGALPQALPDRIPAAGYGTMSNVAIGGWDAIRGQPFAYYETIGGGAGGSAAGSGASGIHVHMTNTRNTPIEALECHYPLRVRKYGLREGSGGEGRHPGGDGIEREIEILCSAQVSLFGDRRITRPYGLRGGGKGAAGTNLLVRRGKERRLPGKCTLQPQPGDILRILTPGGGGWGRERKQR